MHLSSGFLLLETAPGREGQVLELLADVPGVTHRQLLFPSAIAVKIEGTDSRLPIVHQQLRALEGVLSSRYYRAHNA